MEPRNHEIVNGQCSHCGRSHGEIVTSSPPCEPHLPVDDRPHNHPAEILEAVGIDYDGEVKPVDKLTVGTAPDPCEDTVPVINERTFPKLPRRIRCELVPLRPPSVVGSVLEARLERLRQQLLLQVTLEVNKAFDTLRAQMSTGK